MYICYSMLTFCPSTPLHTYLPINNSQSLLRIHPSQTRKLASERKEDENWSDCCFAEIWWNNGGKGGNLAVVILRHRWGGLGEWESIETNLGTSRADCRKSIASCFDHVSLNIWHHAWSKHDIFGTMYMHSLSSHKRGGEGNVRLKTPMVPNLKNLPYEFTFFSQKKENRNA